MKKIRTKVDLPGYKAGTILVKRNEMWYSDNRIFSIPVPEAISKNDPFYEELTEEYCLVGGDKIKIKKHFLSKYKLPIGEYTTMDFIEYITNNNFFAKVNLNGRIFQVDIRHISKANFYYFIDSKGKTQIATIGKEPDVDIYRRSVGNFFIFKEDAKKCIIQYKFV
jgi:hypothetical protein